MEFFPHSLLSNFLFEGSCFGKLLNLVCSNTKNNSGLIGWPEEWNWNVVRLDPRSLRRIPEANRISKIYLSSGFVFSHRLAIFLWLISEETPKLSVLGKTSSGISHCSLITWIESSVKSKLVVDETSHCSISAQNDLGALLKRCKLIIWDEAPMANKLCFEALDHSLRDILRKNRFYWLFQKVHGWDHCNVLKLTANMRLTVGARPEDVTEIQEFAEWILKVGDGELGEPRRRGIYRSTGRNFN
ncbi:ATP-dependent DNA helicase PIF1-like protein [Tanacetum coccineum]